MARQQARQAEQQRRQLAAEIERVRRRLDRRLERLVSAPLRASGLDQFVRQRPGPLLLAAGLAGLLLSGALGRQGLGRWLAQSLEGFTAVAALEAIWRKLIARSAAAPQPSDADTEPDA